MPQIPPLPIHDAPLPYVERLQARTLDAIDLAVIHCTELPDLAAARAYGERVLYASGTGNSGHFYIDRDGSVHHYVPLQRVAHHVRGYNPQSLGIELVNRGRYPHWLDSRHQAMHERYPPAQIQALIALLQQLQAELPQLRHIAGHDALDRSRETASDDPALQVQRKLDPGPRFPWPQVLEAVALTPYAPSANALSDR
ncbi:N-acetylmuramoyl-L-alanine amidase [Xanthomonas translucens]|uniref:N-acetylmuramoyl-L-alanine amidase n=1 Tax=Xanthomonas campestris pv. translucens TaxID=343 RepID=UPI0002A7A6F0|nr:N-acetylmuramoyl-L-alanine amidase [Xanthomonas translucens]AKK68141.1 N-acetylmuramoyl-L-alanine amidase [Xanthomonas translucens pv. undulosa]ELP96647.1 N-acetylmuramyl-L-alanine amidase, negative regulator of AmpC, AmpD [Xanthomonas translucens DAR61454]MBC3973844.1 N-acetylmuramoyl-L-alanine amidase [Xanthomonas translucens pv. undulosa]MCT8270067.1 N-acetylmuramoyl-L-alanine amidase [Xanthomonas translucens pv. undulosa]MCT8282359.1 N-acetylmuramoyl-L-alanine amidase [Xanthomonas trans